MAREYSTDEVIAMMQAPREDVQMLDKPASPFLDPAQINAAKRELSQPDPSIPRPENIGAGIADAAGISRAPAGSEGNIALQNYSASEAFPVTRTPAAQRPDGGSATLYPSKQETEPQLPKPVYSTDEVMALYTNESKPVYSTQDVMKQTIAPLYDPTLPRPSRDEYFKLKDIEKSLKESGDIEHPGAFEIGMKAVGGVLVTAADALATAVFKVDPKDALFTVGGIGVNPSKAIDDTLKRKDATVRLAGEFVKQQYNALSQGLAAIGGPKYRVKETGEFVTSMQQAVGASKMGQAGGLAGVPDDDSSLIDRYKQQGLTLVPVGDEDLKDWEYQQWSGKMNRDLAIHQAANTPRPPDILYRLAAGIKPSVTDYFTGRNDYADAVAPVLANESQANILSMGIDPMVWATSGAGATTRLGISAAAKGATAETLGVLGKIAQKAVKPTEAALTKSEAFKRLIVSPAKVASAYGAAQGVAWAADKLELPSELKNVAFTAASLYGAYKAGVGVLRFSANKLPEASVILRESANATNGFDKAARRAVAANADVPYSIRERLIRPSQFAAMESTPARLAKNMELSPGTRAMMDKLSNWYVVQGVRGASALTTGAAKGAIASVPFAELMRSAGDEDSARAIYGMGAAFGTAGGAAERVFGARGRRYAQAESDIARFLTDVQGNTTGLSGVKRYQWIDREIGRLLTDVELGAGDVSALVKNRSLDELARTAAMQGFYRDKVDFIPLNASDFALNAKGHGADGSAGYFLNAPEGQRPRIFVNVEARRADVEPHEFYEAFFSSDAFSPEQKTSMRAAVDQRYGADGLMARGREYAEQLIKAENSKNFPNENLVVTGDQIAAKMEQLAQDELGRGGQDALDWVRREVMVEEARLAGIDYAALRRNVPPGQNPITFIENILGANARALGLAGVRIDPQTGEAITPEQLFKENPVAANDPKLVKQLNGYIKTYKQWMNDQAHEVPKGARIAPDGRAESLANNPNVAFYDGINGKENAVSFLDASGRVIEKTTKQRSKERKLRGQQIRNMVGSKLIAPDSQIFGLKKWADGRIRAGGKRLPDTMALQTHWKAWLPIIRSLESMSDAGESVQVRYFAKGNSADKVKSSRLSDIDAINREMVFDQWTTNAAGDLLAQFLDLTSVRNRAMRAISERSPALDPANGGPGYNLQAIMDDVNQWMADKRAGKAGEATIGPERKNVVNALINPGTAVNRGKNPIAGAFGRSSAIKTLLLEGINAVSGTGRKGAAMDYNWANGNFMPDKPAPRPDMDTDVPAPRGIRPQMMADEVANDGPKDVYARSIEDIKAVIPPEQRFVGNKAPGRPMLPPDSRPYLQHDLSKPTGNLHVRQVDIDQAWKDAVAETGPAAQRALDEMLSRGFNMVPPNEAHWRAVGNLPLMDRFWYETSAEAMVISFPGMAQRGQSPKVMDTVAATSPLADPNYNAKLAISFLSEDFRQSPAQTPAVVPKGVSDALLGTFGREEQRKIGSFGGTFRFLAGLSDDPPLTTNDRQVASSFGVPDKVFGEFPVMYEAVSRFYNKLRDSINAGPADKSMGAFEAHQLQALSWVQHRAELELARNKNVSQAQAFDGDAYAVAFKRAADELRAEGIAVASDPATGLPIFDDTVLSNPRVTEILAPTSNEFMRDTFQTMKIVTKLTKDGDEFLRNYDESKALGIKGNIKDAETVIARHMNALTKRKDLGNGKKAPSLVTDLARVFDEKAEITRIETGYGTFKGDYGQNLRIPLGSVPEQYRPAFLAILGKYYRQEAQAASRFVSPQPGQAPTSYSAFFRGRVDTDFLGDMAQKLSAAGYEANVSVRPNGVVVDVVPRFTESGPVPIDPALLKEISDTAVGDTVTASVIDRDFSSIYLERPNYANEINKGKKGLLNDTAREIEAITGAGRQDSRAFAEGRNAKLSGNKAVTRRAEKARDRYRQRLSRLESAEARLKALAEEFQKDMVRANRAMRPKLDRRRKAMSKPAEPAPAGLADL